MDYSNKNIKIVFIAIFLIFTSISIYYLVFPKTKINTKTYVLQNRKEKITNFINKNFNVKEKENLVKLAISESINKKIIPMDSYLKDKFWENPRTPISLHILKEYNKKNILIGSYEDILNFYIDGVLNKDLSKELEVSLKKIPKNKLFDYFLKKINSFCKSKNFEIANNYIKDFIKISMFSKIIICFYYFVI